MKAYFLICILFFTLLFARTIYCQDFPYEEYKNRVLSELVEMDSDVAKIDYKAKQLMIHGAPYYSEVRLKFVGTSRPLSAERMNLFKLWQGSIGYDAKVLTLLENEYLFKECDKEYWIPVQKQVAAYFPKEMKAGEMITLYLMTVGGLKTTDKWEFVYLVNEYKK